MWSLAAVNPGHFAYPGLEAMDETGLKYHEQSRLAAIPYTSQANGFFTKALRADFDTNPEYDKLKRLYGNEQTAARVQIVRKLAEENGWEATQIALAYLLGQPIPVIPIIGPRNETQLADSLNALAIKLSERTVEELRFA
jgi:aryl-alcohol dehydrogenase-like predicted oxidoreductase